MKTLLTALTLLITFSSKAQDSTVVQINAQARDLEYIGSFIAGDYSLDNIHDTLKIKFRVPNPVTGTSTMSVGAYTIDWVTLMTKLKNDPTAIKAGTTGRLETLLRAINQSYLTSRLDTLDINDTNTFITMRIVGRLRLRRL